MHVVRLDMLHFSIIQRWYIVRRLSKHLEEENRRLNFAVKWEEKEGGSMLN